MKHTFKHFAAFLFLMIPITASAQLVGFEELYPGYETSQIVIPNGYRGFNWSEDFRGMTAGYLPGTGYSNGATGSMVAYTRYHNPVSFWSPDGSEFNFIGADLTAGRLDNETVIVEGWRDGLLIYTDQIVTSTDGPYSFLFNFLNVDRVNFIPDQSTGDHHIAIDNILVPEPATMMLLAIGAMILLKIRPARLVRV